MAASASPQLDSHQVSGAGGFSSAATVNISGGEAPAAPDGSAVDEERAAGNGGVDGVRVDFFDDDVGDLKGGGEGVEKKWGNQAGRVFGYLLFDIFVNDKNAQQTKGVLPEKTSN